MPTRWRRSGTERAQQVGPLLDDPTPDSAMDATDKNRDNEVPLEKKLDDLYTLIDGIETAMLTTRRRDGTLVSRAMQTQRRTAGADLWFMTNAETEKFEELAVDPHVNVAYYSDRTREWVSVSGHAILSKDRDLIDSLYTPDWKAWLGDQGDGKHDGGPHDPRIALILVEAESVVYSKTNRRCRSLCSRWSRPW